MLMSLTEAENRKIAAGAEEARRRQDAEEERKKTQEFREMKKRNEKKPPEKQIPPVKEFIKQKLGQAARRVEAGVVSFMTVPKSKPRPRYVRRPRQYQPVRRRRARPAPQPRQSNDLLGFNGRLLGSGWGAAPRRKKKGGWGLL